MILVKGAKISDNASELLSEAHLPLIVFGVLLLCLCVNSWGSCSVRTFSLPGPDVCLIGGYNTISCNVTNTGGSWNGCPENLRAGCYQNQPYSTSCSATGNCGRYGCSLSGSITCCDTQAEADSIKCQVNPQAEGCVEEDVPQNCMEDYNLCMVMGGVWKKNASDAGGCSSECNICDSKQQIRNKTRWKNVCCALGKAPPPENSICTAPVVPTGYGMSLSRLLSENGEESCGDTQTADGQPIVENAESFHRYCEEGEEYEEQVDTNSVNSSGSGDSSSSGEGGGSSDSGTSWGTELEALGGLYGVLDTIRDTIVKRLTPATEEIRDCLYSFKLCTQLDSLNVDWSAMPKDSTWFYIDTGLVKYLRPFMDASVALDSNQLKAIRKLDTNALKQLRLDSALLENDTATRRAVNNGFDGVLKNDTATRAMVKGVKDGVDSLIDSMGRYLRAVDSSIGSVGGPGTPLGDSLGHIAGLLGGIDSALNGTGSTALSGDGYGSYGSDSSGYLGTLEGAYGDGDGASDSAYTTEGDTCSTVDCVVSNSSVKVDSLENALVESLDSSYRTIEDSSETWFNQIRQNLKFVDFDSVLVQPLRDVVPNSNTCPEECFKFNADGSSVRWLKGSFDYGVCKSWTIGGVSMNPLMVVRLILRILTAVCCIYIGLWYIGGRRG